VRDAGRGETAVGAVRKMSREGVTGVIRPTWIRGRGVPTAPWTGAESGRGAWRGSLPPDGRATYRRLYRRLAEAGGGAGS